MMQEKTLNLGDFLFFRLVFFFTVHSKVQRSQDEVSTFDQ